MTGEMAFLQRDNTNEDIPLNRQTSRLIQGFAIYPKRFSFHRKLNSVTGTFKSRLLVNKNLTFASFRTLLDFLFHVWA